MRWRGPGFWYPQLGPPALQPASLLHFSPYQVQEAFHFSSSPSPHLPPYHPPPSCQGQGCQHSEMHLTLNVVFSKQKAGSFKRGRRKTTTDSQSSCSCTEMYYLGQNGQHDNFGLIWPLWPWPLVNLTSPRLVSRKKNTDKLTQQ